MIDAALFLLALIGLGGLLYHISTALDKRFEEYKQRIDFEV